ncbi:hypothetical protein P7K49_009966 [Saguinus oedipus]|uniref:Uncharacterized protein n=1 Tax=Saguinus oedipus TaxID=9490 RepID=A0ABQ9VMA6_SAGOE|nr:hypothetical protein P7K49_009966 [Saguinus oedipus]
MGRDYTGAKWLCRTPAQAVQLPGPFAPYDTLRPPTASTVATFRCVIPKNPQGRVHSPLLKLPKRALGPPDAPTVYSQESLLKDRLKGAGLAFRVWDSAPALCGLVGGVRITLFSNMDIHRTLLVSQPKPSSCSQGGACLGGFHLWVATVV